MIFSKTRSLFGEVTSRFGIKKRRKILLRRLATGRGGGILVWGSSMNKDLVPECVQGVVSRLVWLEHVVHGENGGWGCYLILHSHLYHWCEKASSLLVLISPEISQAYRLQLCPLNCRDGAAFATKAEAGVTRSDLFFLLQMSHPIWRFWNDPLVENHCHREPLLRTVSHSSDVL